MEAENGLVEFAETVAEQAHDDIAAKVESGDLPSEALESEYAHKKLIAMHIIQGFRGNGETGDLDYEYIDMVARQASENVIAS